MLRVLACSFVRICDEGDEALQPEWEIDPKDLQLMEKACSPNASAISISSLSILNPAGHGSDASGRSSMHCHEMALPRIRVQ